MSRLIPECPGADEAARLLRTALDDIGLADTPFTVGMIDTAEKARAFNFAGSPAFVVDGTDLFPMEGTTGSLECRVYATPDGQSLDHREYQRSGPPTTGS